jgi:hypothetical protein
LLTFRPGGGLERTVAPAVTRRSLQATDLGLDWFAWGLGNAASQADPDIALCMGRLANCYAGFLSRHVPGAAVVSTMHRRR